MNDSKLLVTIFCTNQWSYRLRQNNLDPEADPDPKDWLIMWYVGLCLGKFCKVSLSDYTLPYLLSD